MFRSIFRRHLARVELVENILPVQSVGTVADRTREVCEVQISLGRIGIVAVVAVGLEEGTIVGSEDGIVVGIVVGTAVGVTVGNADGDAVGICVGRGVG